MFYHQVELDRSIV